PRRRARLRRATPPRRRWGRHRIAHTPGPRSATGPVHREATACRTGRVASAAPRRPAPITRAAPRGSPQTTTTRTAGATARRARSAVPSPRTTAIARHDGRLTADVETLERGSQGLYRRLG